MDIGVISVRYARALLKCSTEAGKEDVVYKEMMTLAESYLNVAELRRVVAGPTVSKASKAKVLTAAAGGNVSEITLQI